jgi:3-phosphoshikimate 1-carboxyvinyltransferase
MDIQVHQSEGLRGEFAVPGDKSISHRALLIGALAEGSSGIEGLSTAADVISTKSCLESLGVEFEYNGSATIVHGKGPRGFRKPSAPLNAGNSGTTMRLLSGILAGQRFDSTIIGDPSLSKRPMGRIIEPLRLMGAKIKGSDSNTAPIQILSTYSLRPIEYQLNLPSAQVKSTILLAGLYTDGVTRVIEQVPTRNHTEKMLGLAVQVKGNTRKIEIKGGQKITPRNFHIPGDISSAAFLIAASCMIRDSDITVRNVGLNETRTTVLDVFRAMNVSLTIENVRATGGETFGDIRVRSSNVRSDITLKGETIALLIDELPMLVVLSLCGEGVFTVRDAGELRHKESDRISAIVHNMRLLGIEIEEYADGFSIDSRGNVHGARLESFGDHRIAMAFGVLGLRIGGIAIREAECVDISFPGFWKTVQA